MNREELLKSAKPILFNTEMVRAIIDGRKTVTRRIVRNGDRTPTGIGRDKFYKYIDTLNGKRFAGASFYKDSDIFYVDGARHIDAEYFKMRYKKGDILYVRETFAKGRIDYGENSDGTPEPYISQCTDDVGYVPKEYAMRHDIGVDDVIWKPSIHMPKEAARIFLKVTNVRCERLQNITVDEIYNEGLPSMAVHARDFEIAQKEFALLWNSTLKKQDIDLYSWNANPWVWVYEFERICADD